MKKLFMENKKKIALIAVIIAIIIVMYVAYNVYAYTVMDKNMKEAYKLCGEYDKLLSKINNMSYEGADTQTLIKEVKKLNEICDKIIEYEEKAYAVAPEPYKEFIGMRLERHHLLKLWREAWIDQLEVLEKGDYLAATEIQTSMDELSNKTFQIKQEEEKFLAKHPDVAKIAREWEKIYEYHESS
ncbi:MAG: hypothetical protein H5T45_04750 [Thermoplasmatales archaeon]|nr:hypothetical protein [Thermoplasmatales archaeon]